MARSEDSKVDKTVRSGPLISALQPDRGDDVLEPLSRHTHIAAMEAASMARRQKTTKRHKPKTILRFPDLEHSKNAVVNSLAAASSHPRTALLE
jgi:hypothetical protein